MVPLLLEFLVFHNCYVPLCLLMENVLNTLFYLNQNPIQILIEGVIRTGFHPWEKCGINRFYIWKISRRKMKTAAKIFPVIRGQLWGKFTFHEACPPYLKLP